MSLFYVDMILIPAILYVAVTLREVEIDILLIIGVFKDLFEMNDREMFQEYDKLRKMSSKVKTKYAKYRRQLEIQERETLPDSE